MVEISVALKYLKNAGMVVPITSTFNSLVYPLPPTKLDEFWSCGIQKVYLTSPKCGCCDGYGVFARAG